MSDPFDREASLVRWVSYGMFTVCVLALIWVFVDMDRAWIGFLIAAILWGVAALRFHISAQDMAVNRDTIANRATQHGAGSKFVVADQDDAPKGGER